MNLAKPGLPDYTGPSQGWFAYIHHDRQLEWSDNILERVAYIVAKKPAHEQAIRMACLTHIPPEYVPAALNRAQRALNRAQQACTTARRAAAREVAALVRARVPDAPWDGAQLVFVTVREVPA